jgi:HSP20 family protein
MEMALPTRRTNNDITSRTNNDVTPWNPFRELDDFHSRFSRLLETTFGDTPGSLFGAWSPPVDIEETDDAFLVEAELPEVRPDDVNVELNDNQLTIHGEIKERERTGVLRRQTRRTGQFDYRVTLPAAVQPDSAEASLKDGVLRLRLHKSEVSKPRRIEVTTS